MLLDKQVQILVFKIDDDGVFDCIGEVSQFTSLMWPDKFCGYSNFELWAPITKDNADVIKSGNIIWCGGDNAAVIEIITSNVNDDGSKTFDVKGRTLEMLLSTRIIWDTYSGKNKAVSTIMYDLVNKNCINPVDAKRKIPYLYLAEDDEVGGIVTCQKTGGDVYETLQDLASSADLGFNILFRPKEKKLIFKVFVGVDRTIEQAQNDPVVFSTELEDILSSSYYLNIQDVKSVALVAGEGEGPVRARQISGNNNLRGLLRRELYVDARDLQRETEDGEGNMTSIPEEEYNQMLIQRGNEKLSECEKTETFEARLRVFGETQYEFGMDYQKGDKVTIQDEQLGVVVSARITEVEEDYGEEYSLNLTFGYSYPTLMQKIKQQVK